MRDHLAAEKTETKSADENPRGSPPAKHPMPKEATRRSMAKMQMALVVMGAVAFLYFARSAVLPIALACVGGMALKPLLTGLARLHVPRAVGAAIVLLVFVLGGVFVAVHLSRPAVEWVKQAPQHVTELKQRFHTLFTPAAQLGQAAAAVKDIATPDDGRKKAPTVEVKQQQDPSSVIHWTGAMLTSIAETLVLLYLLLASGDLFSQKLARISSTARDKRRVHDICLEVQQNISNYLFTVSLINIGLGTCLAGALYFLKVPNAATWGLVAAGLNYIPYFGPIAGIMLVGVVGVLTFDTLPMGLLPMICYLVLHLLEADLFTPVLMGKRFTMNPVIIFCSLIFWTWLWGVAGALLSVPLLISGKAICDRVPALSTLSEFLTE